MISDEDKCFYREEDEQFVFQHVDGRYYIENEHPDFENCRLVWDDEEDVYFFTTELYDLEQFIRLLGFEEYEPFCG